MENLTKRERQFCEIFVNGNPPFVGNAGKCYGLVFRDKLKEEDNAETLGRTLLKREDVKEYIAELHAISEQKAQDVKNFITKNLVSIIEETSTARYFDKRGVALSPAALRSVSVNACKALMELYPVREAQVNKLSVESENGSGVVFNIVAPQPNNDGK